MSHTSNSASAHGHSQVSRTGGSGGPRSQAAPGGHDNDVARLALGLQALRVGSAGGTNGLEHTSRILHGQEHRARLAQDRPAASADESAAPRHTLSSRESAREDVATARALGVPTSTWESPTSTAHPPPPLSRLSLPPWPSTPPSSLPSPPLSSRSDVRVNDGTPRGSLASSHRSSSTSFSFSPSSEGASAYTTPATSPGSDAQGQLPAPPPPRARVRFYRAPSTTPSTSTSTTVTHTATSTATLAAPYNSITPFLASLPRPFRWDLREALPHDLLRDPRCEAQAFATGFSRCKIIFNEGSNTEFFAHCTSSGAGLHHRGCPQLHRVQARGGVRLGDGEATYADLLGGSRCFFWGLKETGASREFAVVLGGRRRPV
ncbi:uncharacterized protein BXZ73DRAFT_105578 [Epithele typhae]|uniref:uncharacterized protein n=1 Tax=Epithele typhae TaxID=378194 RepID=UPI002008B65F|nr:uncharacterized protein BXZ73DRAFT_105578 [Epithele typhae]KAH9917098.1 hypothetical protein BXZ73DRAFT_105578 [Epithele typhae]